MGKDVRRAQILQLTSYGRSPVGTLSQEICKFAHVVGVAAGEKNFGMG